MHLNIAKCQPVHYLRSQIHNIHDFFSSYPNTHFFRPTGKITFNRIIANLQFEKLRRQWNCYDKKSTIFIRFVALNFSPHETCLHMHHNFSSIHAVIEIVFELFSSNNIITPDYHTALHVAWVSDFIDSTGCATTCFSVTMTTHRIQELCIFRFQLQLLTFFIISITLKCFPCNNIQLTSFVPIVGPFFFSNNSSIYDIFIVGDFFMQNFNGRAAWKKLSNWGGPDFVTSCHSSSFWFIKKL